MLNVENVAIASNWISEGKDRRRRIHRGELGTEELSQLVALGREHEAKQQDRSTCSDDSLKVAVASIMRLVRSTVSAEKSGTIAREIAVTNREEERERWRIVFDARADATLARGRASASDSDLTIRQVQVQAFRLCARMLREDVSEL